MITLLLLSALTPFASVLQNEDELPKDEVAVDVSTTCALCHSNAPNATAMRDARGRGIAPYDLWQGTMMANSARDPLWRAAVSAEIEATPSRSEDIQRKCLSCHAPMAHNLGYDDHGTGSLMHILDCESDIGVLARDGVSCTICHGITPEGLGTEASFAAGYQLDTERRLYGPHASPFTMPMRHHTVFTPTEGPQILDSAMCGSCHTLETEALDAEGHAVGATLLEQAPYLEWLNSDYRLEAGSKGPLAASCQDCHAPTTDADGEAVATRIARNPGGRDFPPIRPREPYGRHLFVGGNTLVLSMLRDHPEELRVDASTAAIQATLDATRDQLRNRSARIVIQEVERDGKALAFSVDVENLTGHKLPTAHPTRRAWLNVTVRDADERILFASGGVDARGRIVGADGEPLASELVGGPTEPHRDVVRKADEVATYQAVMADAEGATTHTLLRGAAWLVDDRILPKGWSAEHAEAERTAPVGVEGDANFRAGGDSVRYELELDSTEAVFIEAALYYQPLGARWAAEILRFETPEIDRFRKLYEQAELAPEVLARDVWKN